MATLVSSKTVSAQDLQNLQYTIDTYDDGTKRLRVSGNAAPGTAGTPSADVTSVQGVTGGTPVSGAPSASALTDRSASLTTAGTAQQFAAANTNRKFLSLENLDITNGLWYSLVGTAAASTIGSRYLGPGDAIAIMIGAFVPSNALSVVGTVNAQKVTCWEG